MQANKPHYFDLQDGGKVLGERLKKIKPSIIDPPQSAILEGRQIIDSILIANKVVEEYQAKKKKGWLIKLDLEKAFDRIDCDFLEKVMAQTNF